MPLTRCPSILDRLRDGQLLPHPGPAGTVEGRIQVLFSSGSLVPSPGPGSCSSSVQSLSPLLLECAWALRAPGFLRRPGSRHRLEEGARCLPRRSKCDNLWLPGMVLGLHPSGHPALALWSHRHGHKEATSSFPRPLQPPFLKPLQPRPGEGRPHVDPRLFLTTTPLSLCSSQLATPWILP